MDQNFDDIHNSYEDLAAGDGSSWEIYSGEAFRAKAEEKGIPEDKWSHDRMEMQFGQEAVAEELNRGIPQSPEEWEARLQGFLARQIDSRLNSETDEVARRGMLLQAIQAGREVTESELAALSQKNLSELREELINLTIAYTKNTVLPAMERQCNLLLLEPEQKEKVMKNPAALAAAFYLEVPQMRETASALGAEAEVIRQYTTNSDSPFAQKAADALTLLALGLLFAAGLVALLALLSTGCSVVATVGAHLLVEQTAAGLGAAVVTDFAAVSGFLVSMLKWSAAGAALSAVAGLLAKIFTDQTDSRSLTIETGYHNHSVSVNS